MSAPFPLAPFSPGVGLRYTIWHQGESAETFAARVSALLSNHSGMNTFSWHVAVADRELIRVNFVRATDAEFYTAAVKPNRAVAVLKVDPYVGQVMMLSEAQVKALCRVAEPPKPEPKPASVHHFPLNGTWTPPWWAALAELGAYCGTANFRMIGDTVEVTTNPSRLNETKRWVELPPGSYLVTPAGNADRFVMSAAAYAAAYGG